MINMQASDLPATADALKQQTTQSEGTLQGISDTLRDVLDTMHSSESFPRTRKDASSRFWTVYERVAKQHDDELIERHNGEMDVLLIFAGLFSAVSSAFIVNMQSSLSPSASDTTNFLLKIMINKFDNTTFPLQEATLPVWTGPSSTTIWIQTLAYTSLSSSLLAAFGAVLAKQWLGHFKTSRFGRGALHERCQRRQQKLDGLETWYFSTILATLPILLQLSLCFFGIALAANIWTLQHTVAGVIIATTVFGLIFYFFTVISSLKSSDCPFQTPVSSVIRLVLQESARFRAMTREKWHEHPASWDFSPMSWADDLRKSSGRALNTAKRLVIISLTQFVAHLPRIPSGLRQVRPNASIPEVAGGLELAGADGHTEQTSPVEKLDLGFLDLPIEIAHVHAAQSSAVQWIIETSTDVDNIEAAAGMVPEIEWPAADDVTRVLDRLESHFYACFDSTRGVLPLARARALVCLKAMCHISVEQDLRNPIHILPDGAIFARNNFEFYRMAPDPAYLVVCAVYHPVKLNISSLQVSNRMWMAHMFTHRLRNGERRPEMISLMIDFVGVCLDSKSPVRLVADCLLLAGMLVGLPVDQRQLVRLDKSEAIKKLRQSVMSRTLDVLVGVLPASDEIALQLIHPLLQDFIEEHHDLDFRMEDQFVKLCFRLLEEYPGTLSEDLVRFNSVANLVRMIGNIPYLGPSDRCTQDQFDLLGDYYVRICEDTNNDFIVKTFSMLRRLRGLPIASGKMRRYIDITIMSMGLEITRAVALRAAWEVRSAVASAGRNDESLRECFSKTLTSAILSDATQPLLDNPFRKLTFFDNSRDMFYLELLYTLCQEPTWQYQLHYGGHLDNCFVIADTLTSRGHDFFDEYAVHLVSIFAIIDESGKEHPLCNAVQAYPSWPLVLRAWRYIFRRKFFGGVSPPCGIRSPLPSTADCLAALPSVVAYARKQCNDREEPLLVLVEQVCHKLGNVWQRGEWDFIPHIQNEQLIGNQVILDLGKQIRVLLEASQTVL